MKITDELTVTICTLNEEKNIEECIDTIKLENVKEIIVIDGGSKDNTLNILDKINNIKLIKINKKKGLAYQRMIGVENVSTKYVAILDADHRLIKGSLTKLIQEMETKKLHGIGSLIESYKTLNNYWSDCFDINYKISHNIPRKTDMLGTPCIYKTEVLKKNNFDPFFTGPNDDTDLSYRLTKFNYCLGIGSYPIAHLHRSTFKQFFNKIRWYGKGDAQFVLKHKERLKNILFHQLINYPIIKNVKSFKKGYFKSLPFFLLFGYVRFLSMLFHIVKYLIYKKDINIYST